jgi:hypothetical protein
MIVSNGFYFYSQTSYHQLMASYLDLYYVLEGVRSDRLAANRQTSDAAVARGVRPKPATQRSLMFDRKLLAGDERKLRAKLRAKPNPARAHKLIGDRVTRDELHFLHPYDPRKSESR